MGTAEQRNLEARVSNLENGQSETNKRIDLVESGVNRIALRVAELHGDMKMAAAETRNVNNSVQEIKRDTREMIAMYQATPRLRESVRFWVWAIGAAATALVTFSTVYMAFLK